MAYVFDDPIDVDTDSDVEALAANAALGFWARTGDGTGASRTLTAGNGVSIANGDGSANPTFSINPAKVHQFVATYAALTALVTATGLLDNAIYCTYGRAAEEDGGFGFWRYDSGSSATANGGTVLAIDGGGAGRFFRLLDADKTHYVAWFGALGSATHTVNTLAIQACSAAIEALGTGRMEFDGSASYAIYGDATNTNPLGDFDNCKGVHLAFNGCTFTIARAFTGSQTIFPWVFEGCDGVSWGDYTVTCTQADTPADSFQRGIVWINVGDRNSQVSGGFGKQTGGKGAIDIYRNSSTVTNRTGGIRIKRIEATNVGYPLQLRNSGDDIDVGYILATDATRPIIAYGFKNLSTIVERVSTGATGETQMLFVASGTGSELDKGDTLTEGVELWYKSNTAPTNSSHIGIEARGTSGVTLRDFNIHMDVEMDGSGGSSQQALVFYKTSSSGVYDSTPRGHTVEDFTLRGNVRDVPANRIFDFFKTSLGDWAGETIRNWRVRDLVVTGSASASYEIDFDGFTDGPTFENFTFPGTPVQTGTMPDTYAEINVKDANGLRPLRFGNPRLAARSAGLPFPIASLTTAQTAVTGTTSETGLHTAISIPAGALGANGELRITGVVTATNNANAKTLRVDFGGTDFYSNSVASAAIFRFNTTIFNRNSASANAGTTIGGGLGSSGGSLATGTINTVSAQNLQLTMQLADGADSVTLQYLAVDLVYRA